VTLPQYLYQHVGPLLLLLARVGGLFIFAPLLSSGMLPPKVKALLLFMLTLSIYPLVGRLPEAPADIVALASCTAFEMMIGMTLGLLAALPLYAAQLGGQLIDHQVGMGLAHVYNPALDADSTVIADMILNIAIALFLTLGGLEALLVGVARSVQAVPLGAANLAASPLDLVTSLITSGFELALRVAAPVLGVILLETVASAVVSKTIPQINIMSIGFAIKIVAGVSTLILALPAVADAVSGAVSSGLGVMLQWASGR
jgi:flagellar biosynthetic protein FliR